MGCMPGSSGGSRCPSSTHRRAGILASYDNVLPDDTSNATPKLKQSVCDGQLAALKCTHKWPHRATHCQCTEHPRYPLGSNVNPSVVLSHFLLVHHPDDGAPPGHSFPAHSALANYPDDAESLLVCDPVQHDVRLQAHGSRALHDLFRVVLLERDHVHAAPRRQEVGHLHAVWSHPRHLLRKRMKQSTARAALGPTNMSATVYSGSAPCVEL